MTVPSPDRRSAAEAAKRAQAMLDEGTNNGYYRIRDRYRATAEVQELARDVLALAARLSEAEKALRRIERAHATAEHLRSIAREALAGSGNTESRGRRRAVTGLWALKGNKR